MFSNTCKDSKEATGMEKYDVSRCADTFLLAGRLLGVAFPLTAMEDGVIVLCSGISNLTTRATLT